MDDSPNKTPSRRPVRAKKPTLKALESLYSVKLQNTGIVRRLSSSSDENEEMYTEPIEVKKPSMLHENEVIHGEDIFGFQKRKTKQGLAQKIADACAMKTPYNERKKNKRRIAKMLKEDSESEFEISSEESDSVDETEESLSSNSSQEKTPKKIQMFKEARLQPTQSRSRTYNIKTDEYFEKTASKKIVTSNNTLEKLETPRLPQYELQKLLSNLKLFDSHKDALFKLNKYNQNSFKKWLYFLNENFNILIYGLGSKRHIFNKFHKVYLNDSPVIVVNGYFPSLSIKNILETITSLLELHENLSNINEACDLIIKEMGQIDSHLYLLIYNIEGESLRNSKSQNILAKLASTPNIHLIASIDHINAPLIWDHKKLSKFNYIWWDVTSFAPYMEETSFEQSMMVQQSSTLALSSLRNVFASLTSNSKSIYNIIVKYQLEHSKSQYYQGFSFKDLYMACRESFIVSSDLALRAQLTEFIDHKMLKMKRSIDGTEYLLIPLTNPLLQKFLEENL